MLVFFIHGVATRESNYADTLKERLIDECLERSTKKLPHFYSSLWGGEIDDGSKMWNCVQEDLRSFRRQYNNGVEDVFQYIQYREFFITHFFGDLFTYLNTDKGWEIRKSLGLQLLDFFKKYPQEQELHIVAHSLGGVILWDILFSEKFKPNDPAFYIRNIIKGFNPANDKPGVSLRSITTMGSPILLFNLMLGISPENIKKIAATYLKEPLRWINIIHASDIFAYPISASLNIDSSSNLFFRDKFIASHNLSKKISQPFVGLAGLSMAKGLQSSHTSYWNRVRVAKLVAANILGDCKFIDLVSPYREWLF